MERRTILIIDQDGSQSGVTHGILDDAGYEVTTVTYFDDALTRISPEWPDLLMLAMALKEQDGLELIRAIREDGQLRELPIIVLGARKTRMDALIALEHGADDYVTRPFGQLELVARVGAMLRRRFSIENEEPAGFCS